MLTFLGYTLAVIIVITAVPAGIATGVYVFKKGIPLALEFLKNKAQHKKRDSLDIDIEDKKKDLQWLREKKEKIAILKGLEEEERLLREEIDRDSERLKEDSLIVDIDEERLW